MVCADEAPTVISTLWNDVDAPIAMIGSSAGSPLVLAPPGDMIGLAITEGIEDALTIHEVTGLGAWATGSASRLPALADDIPDYIDGVTI